MLKPKQKEVRIVVKPLTRGVPDTRLTESAQCVYLAARQFARKDITSDFVASHMVRTASRVAVDMTTAGIVDKLSPEWQRSSEKIANQFGKSLTRTDYTFHRNSSIIKSIYAKFSELNLAQGRIFRQADKWNPADIWAIAGVVNVSKIKSIDALNEYLRKAIEKKLILPISLKMTAGLKPVTWTSVNTGPAHAKTNELSPRYTGSKVNTGRTDWMSAKMAKVEFSLSGGKSGWFDLRQSSPGAAINGEMQLRHHQSAQHGKVHDSIFTQAIRQAGGNLRLPNHIELNRRSVAYDPQLIQDTFDLATKLDPQSKVTVEQFNNMLEEKKDPNWLASKYSAMLIVDAIEKLPIDKRHDVVATVYSHALALGELAGPFIKVG
jgi:hypothetical protein